MLIPIHAQHQTEPQLGMEPLRELHLKTLNNFASKMTKVMNEACSTLTKVVDNMAWFYDIHWKEVLQCKIGERVAHHIDPHPHATPPRHAFLTRNGHFWIHHGRSLISAV